MSLSKLGTRIWVSRTPPDVLRGVALGSPLKIVAAIIQENNVALVVSADSPYQTAADLGAAESYGGYGTPHERPLVTEMLTQAGASTPGDFQEVVLQGGAIEALIEDRVDFSAVFQGWSEIAARLRGTELRLFPYVDVIPEIVYPDVVFIARSEMIEQQPDVLVRALRALGDAYIFAAENPDEAASILISEVTDLQQSEALVRESAQYRAPQYLNEDGNWPHTEHQNSQNPRFRAASDPCASPRRVLGQAPGQSLMGSSAFNRWWRLA